ncbi:MAG: tRNA pseudouridine(38-40) synthase TruA [Candidatus Edwardsbacteria bacterium]
MRNIKLIIEYDGTNFAGWQIQPHHRTVQGTIEESIFQLLNEKVTLIGASRTDSGAHALGQVANFKTNKKLKIESIKNGLNAFLPSEIFVHQIEEVPLDFHSRFSAKSRVYQYRILFHPSPLDQRYTAVITYPLDLRKIQSASKFLIGEHDFTSFSVAKIDTEGRKCKIFKLKWKKGQDELVLEIKANRFLQGMIRTIVGTMIEVGRGKIAANKVKKILKAKDRRSAGPTAPPQGLCLVKIEY